jgi:hypothetical protein
LGENLNCDWAEYMLGRAELNLRATKNFSDIAAKFLQSDGTPYDTSSLPPYLATKDRRTHEVKNLIIGEGQKRMTWTMAATPFTGGDGSITDILVAIDDVSRNQTFEHSMTDFVSVASHQLRTPLTGIKWSLDALRKADVKMSDEDKRLLFETCYEASDRMMITIQQLLQVAEFERGGKALKPDEKLSAPNAPPSDAPVRCKMTATMMSADNAICTYGSPCWRRSMWRNPSKGGASGQFLAQRKCRKSKQISHFCKNEQSHVLCTH